MSFANTRNARLDGGPYDGGRTRIPNEEPPKPVLRIPHREVRRRIDTHIYKFTGEVEHGHAVYAHQGMEPR